MEGIERRLIPDGMMFTQRFIPRRHVDVVIIFGNSYHSTGALIGLGKGALHLSQLRHHVIPHFESGIILCKCPKAFHLSSLLSHMLFLDMGG
jgi:hypothetical protein